METCARAIIGKHRHIVPPTERQVQEPAGIARQSYFAECEQCGEIYRSDNYDSVRELGGLHMRAFPGHKTECFFDLLRVPMGECGRTGRDLTEGA